MPARKARLLILGGTGEAVALARAAAARFGDRLAVTSSLAGATADPVRPPGEVRIGGFGGAEGLRRFIAEQGIDLLLDATHPFAATMQANAIEAAVRAGVPRCRLLRPEWRRQPGDRWIEVGGPAQAAEALETLGPRVFLALGGRDLAGFAGLPGRWFLVRAVSPPQSPVIDGLFVQARGPFALADERRLLEAHRIDAVVCRQSGGEGAGAKIAAARALGLPVVMIRRPPAPPPPVVADVAAALDWIAARLPAGSDIEPLALSRPADAG
ncbi:MAG: cobalt-precorrin-6A reductase [Alphaproteobacteria bacterium]|nr:cobalt-precorrin-6A reductase [Alphaproteobacteria bacterium]